MKFLKTLFKDPNAKVLDQMRPIIAEVHKEQEHLRTLKDEELSKQTEKLRKKLKDGSTLEDILPEAFATVRETSRRIMGMEHYDVQILGGIVLHRGQIAEMRTGEGKTLTSTLPIYLNALAGKGVHVVTVNDYLAARDAVWMGQIFSFLGLGVSCIQNQLTSYVYDESVVANEEEKDEERDDKGSYKIVHDYLRPCTRMQAYEADITYGTNNEFGFDYLRDNMAQKVEDITQNGQAYAIIDEVDSILIDEARTPLIISGPASQSSNMYKQFAEYVKDLIENEDYNIDEKMKAATLTEDGIRKMEQKLGVDNIYVEGGISMVHHIEQALKAHTLFQKDKDYVVNGGEIIIVDEFTGRLMQGRRYSEGLHQAIEAKEGVVVQRESQTLATITFQNYFRLYEKLSGMTGTAVTEAEEFSNIYDLEVVVIPTNKSIERLDNADKIYKNEEGKFKAIAKDVKERHEKGQPVLIGTVSIEKNELLAKYLQEEGLKCSILNAKQHEHEGEVIAQAGKKGAITVATNMAGRGVDIALGGQPFTKDAYDEIRSLGGLYVIGTERHESRRIDNQLRGRAGRQGDPGESQFYISMDDDLMRIFGSDRMKAIMERLNVPDDMPIENKIISKSIESAQKKVEGNNFDVRKHVLQYDDVLNKHRDVIYTRRKRVLESESVKDMIVEMIEHEIEQVVSFHTASDNKDDWNMKEIGEVLSTIFDFKEADKKELSEIVQQVNKEYVQIRTELIDCILEKIKAHYESIEMFVKETFNNDLSIIRRVEKAIVLRTIDTLWVEHLEAMKHLRVGIGLRGYGQRDPLVEYKKESFNMFNQLQNLIQKQVVYSIFKINFEQAEDQGARMASGVLGSQNIQLSGAEEPTQFNFNDPYSTIDRASTAVTSKLKNDEGDKVGRNDPCPCGSGKKYKKCHGAS